MADGRVVLVASTLRDVLANYLLTLEITVSPERSYSILDDQLTECGTRIDVVPSPKVLTTLDCLGDGTNASKVGYVVEAEIIVRHKFKPEEMESGKPKVTAIDPLIAMVEQIHDYFVGRDISTATFGAKWKETRFIAAYDPRVLRSQQFFRGGIRVTFEC